MKYFGTKNGEEYGFYLKNFEGAVEVEDSEWESLIKQVSIGNKIFAADENGRPKVVDYILPHEDLMRIIRTKRNALLAGSDWTQLADAALTDEQKEAWRVYRQELRDMPQRSDISEEMIWPTKPQ